MIDTIVTCLLMTMGLGAHLFLHNDKLGRAIEFQNPMEAVDPATENSICEAGVMHKQDRKDNISQLQYENIPENAVFG